MDRKLSTLGWKRECSFPIFGISGCTLDSDWERSIALVFGKTADGSLEVNL